MSIIKRFTALVLALVVALPIMGAPTAVSAATLQHRFCQNGITNQHDLAGRIGKALVADPTGLTVKVPGCRATPHDFLVAFQKGDPDGGLTGIEQLVGYVDGLTEIVVDRQAEYLSACLRDPDEVVMACKPRQLENGEHVYANARTHVINLLSGCANPGVSKYKAPSPCAYIVFETRNIGEHRAHIPIAGPAESTTCYGYRTGKMLNGRFVATSDWHDIAPGCLERNPGCSYIGFDQRAAPNRRTFDGTVDDLSPGAVEIRVSMAFSENPGNDLGVCIEYNDPTTGERKTSFTAFVEDNYYHEVNGERVARIYYTDVEASRAGLSGQEAREMFSWLDH